MTALTLDFWVSIPVPPPSSRVTLAEFLFLPLCHRDENTGQGCAGLPGQPVQGLGPLWPRPVQQGGPRDHGPWGQGKARVQWRHEGGFPEKADIPVTARDAFQQKQESAGGKRRTGTLAFGTMSRGAGSPPSLLAAEAGQAQCLGAAGSLAAWRGRWEAGTCE